jgi:hypothetical protein
MKQLIELDPPDRLPDGATRNRQADYTEVRADASGSDASTGYAQQARREPGPSRQFNQDTSLQPLRRTTMPGY